MDHLPLPKDPTCSGSDRVPYLCQEPYDGGPFLMYPLRTNPQRPYFMSTGNNARSSLYHAARLIPTGDLEAFFQSWLFFGLLKEIFQDCYHPADFIRTDKIDAESRKTLSTSKLLSAVDYWIVQTEDAPSDTRVQYEHLARCFKVTCVALQLV